jgi:hypothetical protein
MSIGNTKEYGNKGNNFPYQLKSLQGLQCACDQLTDVVTNLTTIINQLSGAPAAQRIPNILRVTNTVGTISSDVYSNISFTNVGSGNATVNGVILKAGETINFDAGGISNYFPLGAFTYDTTTSGAELLITYTV